MLKRLALGAALAFAVVLNAHEAAAQSRAICYNCPPEWADWGSQLKAIQSTLGIQVPSDNKNSGQAIAALITEKANPVADVTYLGGIAADPAKDAGVLTPYKPAGWDKIPADLKDPDGYWFTIHSGTLGLFTLETGDTLPKHGFAFSAFGNKFGRMPGSVTLFQVGIDASYGVTDNLSIYATFDPYGHVDRKSVV